LTLPYIFVNKESTPKGGGFFIKHTVDHSELLDTIPDGAELDFIDKKTPIKTKK